MWKQDCYHIAPSNNSAFKVPRNFLLLNSMNWNNLNWLMDIKWMLREHTVLGLFLFSSSAAGKHWLVIMLDVLLIAYRWWKTYLPHKTQIIYLS